MRRFFLMCLLPIFLATGVFAQPQADEYPYDLTYFLPEGSQVYDPQVPTPEKILGFQLGEQHAGWDQGSGIYENIGAMQRPCHD